jgi:hypothetical protein
VEHVVRELKGTKDKEGKERVNVDKSKGTSRYCTQQNEGECTWWNGPHPGLSGTDDSAGTSPNTMSSGVVLARARRVEVRLFRDGGRYLSKTEQMGGKSVTVVCVPCGCPSCHMPVRPFVCARV